jgi:hypothetical protein
MPSIILGLPVPAGRMCLMYYSCKSFKFWEIGEDPGLKALQMRHHSEG